MLSIANCRRSVILLVILRLVFVSQADNFELSDQELEFEDDAMDNYDLKREINLIPDWNIPMKDDEGDRDFLHHRKRRSTSNMSGTNNNQPSSVLDAYMMEDWAGGEFVDEDLEDPDNLLPRKRRSLLSKMWNYMSDLIFRRRNKSSREPTKCSDIFQALPSTLNVSCGEMATLLGTIKWCRFDCKQGYRLVDPLSKYELCGRATKYRWSFQLKGLSSPDQRCEAGQAENKKEFCTTKECFAAAAYYTNKIDYGVNPCNNFYDFACGRWIKESKIPKSRSYILTYSVLRDRVSTEIAELLQTPLQANDSMPVSKAKKFYLSCMNTDLIEALDSRPLLKFLKGAMAWPIIEKHWTASSFNFERTAALLRGKYNNKYTLSVKTSTHKGKYILEIWKGSMPLPLQYYVMKKLRSKLAEYYLLVYDIAVMLGADAKQAFADVENMKVFEKKLAEVKMLSLGGMQLMNIKTLQEKIPSINWMKFLNLMVGKHQLTWNTFIKIWSPVYLKNFAKLLKQTDKRTIQNYMVWTIVKFRINNLSERFRQRVLKYEQVVLGRRAMDSREQKCTKETMFAMKGATSKMFIDHYFTEPRKQAAEELFKHIKQGFLHLLDTEVKWMDSKTKEYARKKALAIKPRIGYNSHLYDNMTYLNDLVEMLKINQTDYFGNYLRLLERSARQSFSELGQFHNQSIYVFRTRATTVNAFYAPRYNTMVLPAGELQYPFYWGALYQRVLEFGAIGTILGHELTHGFDNLGRKFDINGNLKNWWSQASLKEFKKRSNCIKKQYNNYYWEAAGSYLDGDGGLGENIADNGGIRESYAGYKLWLKSKKIPEEKLNPGIGLTNDQMFFVAFANDRCSHFTREGATENLAVNPHSPGRFRVIGSLQNFEKFSKAFNCPVGSYMNPPEKCIIW